MANKQSDPGKAKSDETPESAAPTVHESATPKMQRGSKRSGWAKDLRKLYEEVVAEPLPDSFNDLLSKLDETGD